MFKVTAPRPIDRRRYALHKKGHSIEEIASIEKVSPEMINKSLLKVTMYQDFYSHEAVDASVNEIFMSRLDGIKSALDTALNATRTTYVTKDDGTKEAIQEVDTHTRLKAIETAKGLIETIRPKGNGVSVNVQQNNNNVTNNVAAQGGFEGIVRRIRERQSSPVIVEDVEFTSPACDNMEEGVIDGNPPQNS